MYKPMVLAVVTEVLSAPLLASTSHGFSLFPEGTQSGSSPVLASGMAIALLAGGYYGVQRIRRFSKSQEQRVQRQLMSVEKLALRIEQAESSMFKSNYLPHAARAELRHALDAIITDTVRGMGNLRRHKDLPDSVFKNLMTRSDELFDTLESSMATALPESEEGSEPSLMPRRSNPLPRPMPQPRPQDALNSLEPIPFQAATIPMPAKVQPKGANADDASKMILADQGMTSILLGGGMFYSADDQGNDVACSGFDGRMD
jgi:hypothetical protein